MINENLRWSQAWMQRALTELIYCAADRDGRLKASDAYLLKEERVP